MVYRYKCTLDRIVDGDTLDAWVQLGYKVSLHKRIRLYGINTPESRTRDLEEKARGLASKQRLIDLVAQEFWLVSHDQGKYGRCLGTIYKDEHFATSINQQMVDEGFAVVYHGGKR